MSEEQTIGPRSRVPRHPTYPKLRQEIAGVDVASLAREFGTPTFVYDGARIVERIEDLRAFDVVRYAQKACSNIAILDLCRRHGALVDATSAGELHRALAAGYEAAGHPPPIVYTADVFDAESLDMVIANGVHVNCGSPDMIDQYGRRVPGGEITLRLNPGFGHGHSRKTNTGGEQSKHGVWHEQLTEAVERARRYDLTVSGLHVHIGSGSDLEHLSGVCGALERLVHEAGESIGTISAGGGLPIPYREDEAYMDVEAYYALWDETRKRLERALGHRLTLEIEPGRYLTAESGYLVTEIRAVKTMGSNTFYLVDAGFNNLARPVLYGAYHPISIASTSGDGSDRSTREVIVGGALCESGDIFTQEEGGVVRAQTLLEAHVGDLLVIECAGAYGSVMGSNYNSKPMAAEVLVRDRTPYLVRSRQTLDQLISNETIPELG